MRASAMPIVSDLSEVEGGMYPLLGSLLDQFRSEPERYPDPAAPYRLIAVANRNLVEAALRPGDWNELDVMARGARIEIGINGVRTVDYAEEQEVPGHGLICLQLHMGPPSRASHKDIFIGEY